MKKPDKIKIGGHWYEIIWGHKFVERGDICGQHDWFLKRMLIGEIDPGGNQRADSGLMVTFIHEICHAIDSVCCAGQLFVKKEQDNLLETFAEGLYQVLVDNGWLNIQAEGGGNVKPKAKPVKKDKKEMPMPMPGKKVVKKKK